MYNLDRHDDSRTMKCTERLNCPVKERNQITQTLCGHQVVVLSLQSQCCCKQEMLHSQVLCMKLHHRLTVLREEISAVTHFLGHFTC